MTNLPVGWIKDRQKPLDFFNPTKDKPDYWHDFNFNWDENKAKKAAVVVMVTQ